MECNVTRNINGFVYPNLNEAVLAVSKKEKTAPEALEWLVNLDVGFQTLQMFCERCATEASHAMPDLIELWDHKREPDWRGLVCSLVNLKPVMLKWARVEPKFLPVMINFIAPKYPLGMGDEFCLLLAEHKPGHAIELLKDEKLQAETAFKLAHRVCDENPLLVWEAYNLLSFHLMREDRWTCGDYIALRLLALAVAEGKKERLAILPFLHNSIKSTDLHEKFFAFWLAYKPQDEELLKQARKDLEDALKK